MIKDKEKNVDVDSEEFEQAFKDIFQDEQLTFIKENFMLLGGSYIEYAYGSFETKDGGSEIFQIRTDYSDDASVEIYRLNTINGADQISPQVLFELLDDAKLQNIQSINLDE